MVTSQKGLDCEGRKESFVFYLFLKVEENDVLEVNNKRESSFMFLSWSYMMRTKRFVGKIKTKYVSLKTGVFEL